jgi:hypothetical protein
MQLFLSNSQLKTPMLLNQKLVWSMHSVPYALCKCFLYSLSIIRKQNPLLWKSNLALAQSSVIVYMKSSLSIVSILLEHICKVPDQLTHRDRHRKQSCQSQGFWHLQEWSLSFEPWTSCLPLQLPSLPSSSRWRGWSSH